MHTHIHAHNGKLQDGGVLKHYLNDVGGRVFVINGHADGKEGGATQNLLCHETADAIDVPAWLVGHVEKAPPTWRKDKTITVTVKMKWTVVFIAKDLVII